ncbi:MULTISPECIES: pimeloyl-ACP methyl ester esterase BioH [Thalassotalea]|uniref:Pimeloyl-[acyl-carrier protein] methyl ester esterase n=1 Tax=Thalassotalea castellviae TaxID=3075612 RepID=A0ABU3A4R9_9GAMM|nr:pimeloyl-ACP methyl ester esterase BioH [Thalassotalea sp. W431]MDT0604108.1 pimeloyl-ACP methyl ester esterase BioH [Thalassotalea sp. W431]
MLKFTSSGAGLPLVFIHGWGLNSGVWQPSVKQLEQSFRIITVDLPGFGNNLDYQVSPYTIKNIAQHIADIIDEPAVIIGWSLGGIIATELACSHPDKVLGLITVASTPCFVEQENWPGIKPEVLSLFHRQLEEDTQKTINNFLKIQAMGSPHLRNDIKQLRELIMQYPMPSKSTLDLSLRFLEQEDQRQQLKLVSQPFLRIYGKLDGLVPKAVIEQVSLLAHESDVVIFEKASHAPFISELENFVEKLSSWLNQRFVSH